MKILGGIRIGAIDQKHLRPVVRDAIEDAIKIEIEKHYANEQEFFQKKIEDIFKKKVDV